MKYVKWVVRVSTLTVLLNSNIFAQNVGQKLSDFTLPLLGAKLETMNLQSIKSDVVLLNFWASWCNSCKKELPLLDGLAKKFKDQKFKVVLVNLDRKATMGLDVINALQKKKNKPLSMVLLFDKEKTLFKKHPARGYPYTLLIKNGTIIADYLGSFDESSIQELENKIAGLL